MNAASHVGHVFRSRRISAFTMVEMLLVITLVVMLASISVPMVIRAIGKAQLIKCRGNLMEISKAIAAYSNDNYLRIPPAYTAQAPDQDGEGDEVSEPLPTNALWLGAEQARVGLGLLWNKDIPGAYDYIGNPEVFFCPGAEELTSTGELGLLNWNTEMSVECSYIYRGEAFGASVNLEENIKARRAMVLDYNIADEQTEMFNENHGASPVNVLYADNSVEQLSNREEEFTCHAYTAEELRRIFENADAAVSLSQETPTE